MKRTLALLALLALSGCSTNTSTSVNDTTTPNDVITTAESRCIQPEPDLTDANAVADAAALMLACHDTQTDSSSFDAMRRATPWLDPALLDGLPTEAPADANWTEMALHHGWTEVTVETIIMEAEPDLSSTPVILTRMTTATPTGDDGWSGSTETTYWSLTMEKMDENWVITNIGL